MAYYCKKMLVKSCLKGEHAVYLVETDIISAVFKTNLVRQVSFRSSMDTSTKENQCSHAAIITDPVSFQGGQVAS